MEPPSLGRRAAAALAAGALAGAATGLIDGLWSWRQMARFVPDVPGRARALLFLAASYALFAALAAAAATLLALALWRGTRLGHIAARRRARERTRDDALIQLALVLAGIPALGAALAAGYWLAWSQLSGRKHIGLMLAAAMGIAVAALVAAALLALLVGRPLEAVLRRLASRPAWARALTSPRAPLVAGGSLLALAALAAAVKTWDTLSLLPLRPLWIALLAAALYAPSLAAGRRLAGRISGLRPLARRGALGAGLLVLFAVALVAGSAEGPREAAAAHSGAGAALARALRRLGDLDRDGYSRLLGGGDCDDGDPDVHPGAREVPDDGLDNNCIGGDASTRPAPPEPFAPLPAAVPRDLDVLLITIDTLRADHVGAYGYRRPTTPRIDELAARGAVFENAWAHAPSTRYSIPAILTGRYPLEVEYVDIPREWPGIGEGNTTIAEVMKARGLSTSAVLNYWYFDKKRRMDQGFDHYDNTNKRLHKGVPGEGPARTSGTSAREQTAAAIAELDRMTAAGPESRFFLWVHYYDPHMDYERHPGTKSFGSGKMDLYDHEIRFTDEQVGKLLDHLGALGVADRTAVVITGDHGEGFGEHGIDLHGYHLYAPQTRVPLIIRIPGLPARRIRLPAGHVDILPTLANLLGAEPVPGAQGRSLVDVLAGAPGPSDRQVFQQLSYEGHHEMRAAASRACHVIYNVSPDSSWEVYAIDKDPGETRDMSGAPGACAASVDALAAWYDQTEIPDGAAEALLAARPAIAHPLDVDFDSARLLEVAGLDHPVRAGASIPLTFTFEARGAPLTGGWKVFVHLEGVGRRFQGDHEPPRPLAWWRPGQFIRYTHAVPVPPGTRPGRYQVFVGLFRGSQRHAAQSASTQVIDDRVLVGTIDVER